MKRFCMLKLLLECELQRLTFSANSTRLSSTKRRARPGEMLLLDGSPHDWQEGRGPLDPSKSSTGPNPPSPRKPHAPHYPGYAYAIHRAAVITAAQSSSEKAPTILVPSVAGASR